MGQFMGEKTHKKYKNKQILQKSLTQNQPQEQS